MNVYAVNQHRDLKRVCSYSGHTLFVYIHQWFSIFIEITTFLEKGVSAVFFLWPTPLPRSQGKLRRMLQNQR